MQGPAVGLGGCVCSPLAPARFCPCWGLSRSGCTEILALFSHGCRGHGAELAALPMQGWVQPPWLSHASTQQVRLERHHFKMPRIFWRRTYVQLMSCRFSSSSLSLPSPPPCLRHPHTRGCAPSPQQPHPPPPGLMSPSLGTACTHRPFAAKPQKVLFGGGREGGQSGGGPCITSAPWAWQHPSCRAALWGHRWLEKSCVKNCLVTGSPFISFLFFN